MEINKIYQEPCLETLRKMPSDFLDCVITSPPYWQLRDYGYDGQWGLEPTFELYLENLWSMMDEIYRVLKPSGSVWINLGDTYGGGNSGKGGDTSKHTNENPSIKGTKFEGGVKKPLNKCLLLIPHRFAIGCIERGWIVRNDIIWAKRNGMPESVTDRFSKKHEYVFFMTKSEKYYFDLDSIRDKVKTSSLDRYKYSFNGNKNDADRDWIGYAEGDKTHLIPQSEKNQMSIDNFNLGKYSSIENESEHRQGMNKSRGNNVIEKRPNLPTHNEFVSFIRERLNVKTILQNTNFSKTTIEHWFRNDEVGFSYPSSEDWNSFKHLIENWDEECNLMDEKLNHIIYETDDINKNLHKGKNCGDVADFWDIPTKPSSLNHYASYNDALIQKPILAGCPEGGLIYDPFMGTGSTADACLRAKRNYIGSEMSSEYCKIANARLKQHDIQPKLF